MPIVDKIVTLPSGQSLDVMENDQYQYVPFETAKLDFAFKAQFPIAGATSTPPSIAQATVQVFSGSDLLKQTGPIIVEGANGLTAEEDAGFPSISDALRMQFPYDFLLTDVGVQGERIGVTIANAAGSSIIVRAVVRIMPA